MSAPSSRHVARYTGADPDGCLHSDVFERVSPALIAALGPWFGRLPGTVLEIGAGTGQNAAAFARAFPALAWHASDPVPEHRVSCLAWARRLRVPERPTLGIDAAADWAALPDVAALGPLSAVVSTNVIHITPFAVAEGIVAGAARVMAPGGLLVFAGPFAVHGRQIGPGNAAFHAGLQAENPDWGLRDVTEIEALAEAAGLSFAALEALPANNRLLVFRKG